MPSPLLTTPDHRATTASYRLAGHLEAFIEGARSGGADVTGAMLIVSVPSLDRLADALAAWTKAQDEAREERRNA